MTFNWTLPGRYPEEYEIVHKFGRNPAVSTAFVPVTIGGVYQTPQVAAAKKLRVKAGNVADNVAGAGARQIMAVGLSTAGAEKSTTLATNGSSAGALSAGNFLRLYRSWVSQSGTYANTSTGSHVADIVLETSGGAAWLTINSTNYPRGQSEIAAYSVPAGQQAFVKSMSINVQSNQRADVMLMRRDNITAASAPFDAMRQQIQFTGINSQDALNPDTPLGPYAPGTDLIFMAKAATAAAVDIDFEIILQPTKNLP